MPALADSLQPKKEGGQACDHVIVRDGFVTSRIESGLKHISSWQIWHGRQENEVLMTAVEQQATIVAQKRRGSITREIIAEDCAKVLDKNNSKMSCLPRSGGRYLHTCH